MSRGAGDLISNKSLNSSKKTNLIQEVFIINNWTMSFAESCTGGAVCASFIENTGASRYIKGGLVAYSDDVKKSTLNVKSETLESFGSVSTQVAKEMAYGAKKKFSSTWALSTTGYASPNIGDVKSLKQAVCVAIVGPDVEWCEVREFADGKSEVGRIEVIDKAKTMAIESLFKKIS